MKYRRFGKLDWDVSVLGFGAMRLPVVENEQSNIDEAKATRMIRHAIDRGVNYLDTAYVYHGGNSEILVGKALRDGYREKVKLATKLPPWLIAKSEDFDIILDRQLHTLQTDHIEFYLLHGMNQSEWPKLRDLGVLTWAEKALADGRIGHLGFSFHDTLECFREIVDFTDKWTFCQIQYNFMDTEFQAGREGLEYAAGKGLAIVVMEPLRGGVISRTPPENIGRLWSGLGAERTRADLALQWVWNNPNVATVLSGMSNMEQVEENLASAERAEAEKMSVEEFKIFNQIKTEFELRIQVPCTSCKYCVPCDNNVNINSIFERYNNAFIYGDHEIPRSFYRRFLVGQQADNCTECGECEEVCPQDIPIIEWLQKAHEFLK